MSRDQLPFSFRSPASAMLQGLLVCASAGAPMSVRMMCARCPLVLSAEALDPATNRLGLVSVVSSPQYAIQAAFQIPPAYVIGHTDAYMALMNYNDQVGGWQGRWVCL